MQGLEFFGRFSPRDLIENALTNLDAAAKELEGTGLSNSDLQRTLHKVTTAINQLRDFVRLHGAAREALSTQNIDGIVRWYQRQQDSAAMEFRQDRLILHRDSRQAVEFRLPVIPPLDETPLRQIRT